MKVELPPTVSAPLPVMLPVVAVMSRLPPTFDVARSTAVAFTTAALPVAPLVFTSMAPVAASWARLILAFAALVVNEAVPPTVAVPLSTMLPVLAVTSRLPPTLDAARSTAVAFTSVALPVAPLVFTSMAPVTASWARLMSAFAALVVNEAVPPTVVTPLSMMLPVVAVTARLPAAPVFTEARLMLPLAPVTSKFRLPLATLTSVTVRSVTASVSEKVKLAAPVSLSTRA